MIAIMEASARGALELLTVLHEARRAFGEFGRRQAEAHPSVDWNWSRVFGGVGHGVDPIATVGTTFGLRDEQERDVSLDVAVWVRDGAFEVEGTATVDEPLPERGTSGNQRFLIDLPTVRTADLEVCLSTLREYTQRLCSADSLLDDLGVPRSTPPA